MIRVCPKRDAICPHGMECPYAVDRYTCKEEPPKQATRMADEMGKFFGLDNPAGQAALGREREKLGAEIKAAFGVPRHLLGKDVAEREPRG